MSSTTQSPKARVFRALENRNYQAVFTILQACGADLRQEQAIIAKWKCWEQGLEQAGTWCTDEAILAQRQEELEMVHQNVETALAHLE